MPRLQLAPLLLSLSIKDKDGLVSPFDLNRTYTDEHGCFPAGTLVSGAQGAAASFTRWYSGELVEIRTASGRFLSATPNHPILTREGWISAGLLHEGSYVFSGSGAERVVPLAGPDDQQVPALIEDVAGAVGGLVPVPAMVVPTTPEDFHGDGVGSEVHVVRTDRLLRNGVDVESLQLVVKPPLLSSHPADAFTGKSGVQLLMERPRPAFARSEGTGLGEGSQFDSGGEDLLESSEVDSVVGRDALERSAVEVSGCEEIEIDSAGWTGSVVADRVEAVRRVPFSGHVYNLSTANGWYVANNIVVSNCLVDFGWAQREFCAEVERQYNASKPVRIIVLKARQLGISTLTEGILFLWNFLHPGTDNLVIAHQTKSTRSLFEKTKLYWRSWPIASKYALLSDTQHRLAWTNLSSVEVATAGSVQTARGMTLSGVHASEVSRWDDPDELMLGLKQTIPRRPKTLLVLESTANGRGDYFHQTWTDAEAGVSEYSPLFFPWWKHYEYTAQHIGVRPEIDGQLDSDEKFLRETFGLDENRLAWRRFSIDNDCNGDPDFFKQEFPATPHEAFLHTGNNIFSEPKLLECYAPMEGEKGFFQRYSDRVEWIPDRTGPWTIFFQPADDREYGQYFVGADPTHSTGTDRACIQVINRRSLEQVAVYHGYDEPIRLGHEVLKAAEFYNEAMVSSEAEGPGYGVIATILNSNYPNVWQWRRFDRLPGSGISNLYGWSNGWKNKELAVSHLRHMVNKGEFGPLGKTMGQDGRWHAGIHDAVTFAQMCDFSVTDRWVNGSMYGNADPKGYDDAVDALCIAHICSHSEGPLEFYDTRATSPNLEPDLEYPIQQFREEAG